MSTTMTRRTLKHSLLALSLGGALMSSQAAFADSPGALIIAGGFLQESHEDVFQAVINPVDKPAEEIRLGVVPAATGNISGNYDKIVEAFSRLGLSEDNIRLLPLAVNDDKRTEDVDESEWADNGRDEELAASIDELDAIWFLGGDQTRITAVLLEEDGSDTPVLAAIRDFHSRGGVLAGTSAGAAIMSSTMLAGGDSKGALFQGFSDDYESMNNQEYGPAVVRPGLGFFEAGLIDQHFDRKARLGRLLTVMLEHEGGQPLGVGIDEGTALIVDNGEWQVAGRGGITLVDTSETTRPTSGFPITVENVRLSYLLPGDRYQPESGEYHVREGAYETLGSEYFEVPVSLQSGLFSANRNLQELIGFDLLDNSATEQVTSLLIGDDNQALRIVFTQDEQTQGYWSQDMTLDIYSFENVRMDLEPLRVEIHTP
ncbi:MULTISPECIES: cyanophycinase [Vreelandella]|uniref:Cyanophycinase n=2 Tax=Vreelandella TaxID=3137766 RepID=A0A7C9JRU2_9GAMM|nr:MULTISPECIES: cyanophycinase [Halomonas]NDL69523.1 cyanophycinase [Halomonas alkaliphila]NYS43455.1 cyanophycinase [Halomonas zhaodongensis]